MSLYIWWFLQRLGTRESYTSIETIYRTALERGMRFVTITDHNQIEGSVELHKKYPHNTFTGVESTAYFPEDGCKIHVLVYGLTRVQFCEIEQRRTNIYDLRDYLKSQRLPHSVAHATFSINKKLTEEHIYNLLSVNTKQLICQVILPPPEVVACFCHCRSCSVMYPKRSVLFFNTAMVRALREPFDRLRDHLRDRPAAETGRTLYVLIVITIQQACGIQCFTLFM